MVKVKEVFLAFFHSRLAIASTVMVCFSAILIGRLFYLQIVNGDSYQQNYTLQLQKERSLSGTRGNIYDRYGNLLAYNELSYSVTFEDNGTYSSSASLNEAIIEIVSMIEENGDHIDSDDYQLRINALGNPEFTVSGSRLNRYRADIYGHIYVSELTYNKSLGYDESEASAQQVFDYLKSKKKYNISDEYSNEEALKIIIVREAISANSYQKYISSVIASDVNDRTVAKIEENKSDYSGLNIEESTKRYYNSSKYFAQIIGYTGKISSDEYETLSAEDDSYSLTDVVGKAGIEKAMESTLRGVNGYESLYVDNVGNVLEVRSYTEPSTGDDVYLTLDSDLQITAYNLLEQELGGILFSNMVNVLYEKEKNGEYMIVGDVYFALLNNNVLDLNHFSDPNAGEIERGVYQEFLERKESVKSEVLSQLNSPAAMDVNDCDYRMQDYEILLMSLLYDKGIIDQSEVDTSSAEYNDWKNGECSLQTYLKYCISSNNIDTENFVLKNKYADLNEIYEALVAYIEEVMETNTSFTKQIYEHMVQDGSLSGYEVCMMLYEQGVLSTEDDDYNSLSSGSMSAYGFIRKKVLNLEITAAQLALDPCNASCVIVDPHSGQVLACVTYPGYDNNMFANSVDSEYYAKLSSDQSNPLLNFATMQRTAPGSTFKPVSATAALTEGYITTDDVIKDEGIFEKAVLSPTCWVYPRNHGTINVTEAIRVSCNYFFYEMGYQFSTRSGEYVDSEGLAVLQKYAKAYGLGDNTGIEITESTPQISNEDAVRSAIGQGTHNYTTSQLARYVAAVANRGTVYNLSLIYKTVDVKGKTLTSFTPKVFNTLDEVSDSTWDAIHLGMREMIQDIKYFDAFEEAGIAIAGKTGTAQEQKNRPNHSLFVGFAPVNNPTIAIATRIAFGYSSGNATEVTSNILKYYFSVEDYDTLSQTQSGTGSNLIGD